MIKRTASYARDTAWYGEWFRAGFRCFDFGEPRQLQGLFAGAEGFFTRDRLVDEALAAFFETLGPNEQADFKLGLREAMRRLDCSREDERILALRFLDVATTTSVAAKDAIHVLANLIKLQLDDGYTRRLVWNTTDALARFPLPGDAGTADALARLSESPHFGETQARVALLAMCESRPLGLPSHLRRLHPLLQARYAREHCRPQDGRRWLERRGRVLEVFGSVQDAATIQLAFDDWRERPHARRRPTDFQDDWWCASLQDPEIRYEVDRRVGVGAGLVGLADDPPMPSADDGGEAAGGDAPSLADSVDWAEADSLFSDAA